MPENESYVLDTSVVIEKVASDLIKKKQLRGKLLIPNAVMAELEHQANQNHETGLLGLEELQELQELAKEGNIQLEFTGERPSAHQIRFAKSGEIDASIRNLAYNTGATLITADKVQASSAKAFGVEVKFIELKLPTKKIEVEKFFDNTTMSVHLKEKCSAYAKRGSPDQWNLIKITKNLLTKEEVERFSKEIVEKARMDAESFVEISRRGSTIVQYKDYRVVITRPPVSDSREITIVRPIKKLDIKDYKLPPILFERIKEKARGIIIAGETGSGKSTFAQAIAEFYSENGKIVKTVESPRDLQLKDEITQYSKNFTSSEEIHDILFLSRPDNIIFDEIRDTTDFKLYTDLRLAGSNCLGVLHSSSPVNAVQRFISRLDTGMIPSVLDTLIFIEKGRIGKVLTVQMNVKVPTGMTEADLARPVVEIRDFTTKKLEFEIYSYGEETVVVPVEKESLTPIHELAKKEIGREFSKLTSKAEVSILNQNKINVAIPEGEIGKIIGKAGQRIEEIEKKLGIKINISPLEGKKHELEEIESTSGENKKYISLYINPRFAGQTAHIHHNNTPLFTQNISRSGEIKVHKRTPLGRKLIKLLNQKQTLKVKV
ncbi:MAG: PINc/VapC family ATPase [Nanoarchaeota archaeon]|nr:PINc/VapC family ATPase [Nanoarchaeota archaeon]